MCKLKVTKLFRLASHQDINNILRANDQTAGVQGMATMKDGAAKQLVFLLIVDVLFWMLL